MQFSIVNFSQIDKSLLRLEAEFYKPAYLAVEKKFRGNPTLAECAQSIICGPFGSTILDETYTTNGVKVIRPFNIKEYQIEKDNIVYISKKDAERKQLKFFFRGAIFFSRVGDVKCGILSGKEGVTISPNIIAVDIKREKYHPFFLTLFFNSKYGLSQIERELKILAQPTVSTYGLRLLKLPMIDFGFQNQIGALFEEAVKEKSLAENRYELAQELLLSELGLANYQPCHKLTFVKLYSDIQQAGRVDAEYFQPKYDEIINAIQGHSGEWAMLKDLVSMEKCTEVGSDEYLDEGIPFVRVSNISPFEITKEKYISEELYGELKHHQPQRGEILFSKDATPGIAYYLNETPPQMIPSSGILRLKNESEKINGEYLALVLNSLLVKEQMNRDVGGSVILHWLPKQIGEVAIPILPKAKQAQIQQKVAESFKLRKQSKHLLECAKRAVEIAIEKDEKRALEYLKKETAFLKN